MTGRSVGPPALITSPGLPAGLRPGADFAAGAAAAVAAGRGVGAGVGVADGVGVGFATTGAEAAAAVGAGAATAVGAGVGAAAGAGVGLAAGAGAAAAGGVGAGLGAGGGVGVGAAAGFSDTGSGFAPRSAVGGVPPNARTWASVRELEWWVSSIPRSFDFFNRSVEETPSCLASSLTRKESVPRFGRRGVRMCPSV